MFQVNLLSNYTVQHNHNHVSLYLFLAHLFELQFFVWNVVFSFYWFICHIRASTLKMWSLTENHELQNYSCYIFDNFVVDFFVFIQILKVFFLTSVPLTFFLVRSTSVLVCPSIVSLFVSLCSLSRWLCICINLSSICRFVAVLWTVCPCLHRNLPRRWLTLASQQTRTHSSF